MSLVSQLQTVMTRIGTEFKSVRTAISTKADKTTTVSAGTGLSGGGDLSASRSLSVVYGTVVNTAAQGNDSRLSDARTPLAHNHDASAIVSGTLADARLPARIGIYGVGITDWNTVVQNGFWMAAGAANAPSTDGAWWKGIAIVHNDLWITQLVGQFTDTSTTQSWFMRHSQDSGGTRLWGAWHRVQLTQASQDARYVQLTDARLSDARTPTAHTHDDRYYTKTQSDAGYVTVARQITAGTGLTGGGTLQADRALAVNFGNTSGTAAQGNDSRLSDARTPLSHNHSAAEITTGTLGEARLPTRIQNSAQLVTDWNLAVANGWFYSANTAANAPSYPYVGNPPTWYGEVVAGNNFFTQTVTRSIGADFDTATFQRRYDPASVTWSAWYKVLQSATEIQGLTDALYKTDIVTTRDTTVHHVKMATTANITLTGATTSIDGVAVTNNCRILVKNQTNPAQNGVYVGATGTSAWSRTSDLDTTAKWNNLAPSPIVQITVQEGTQAGTDWIAKFPNTSVLGVDPLTFSPVSANLAAGNFTEDNATADTLISTNPGSIPAGLSRVITVGDQTSLYAVEAEIDTDTSGTIWSLELLVDGVSRTKTALFNFTGRQVATRSWSVTGLTPGNHTFALRVNKSAGNNFTVFGNSSMRINHVTGPGPTAREIALPFFKGSNIAATTYTNNVNVPFATRTDTGGWNASGNYWVVPVTGRYRLSGQVKVGPTAAAPIMVFRRNGTIITFGENPPGSFAYSGTKLSNIVDLVAGDQISMTTNGGFTTQADAADNNYFIIEWVPTSLLQPATGFDSGWIAFPMVGGYAPYGGNWQVPQYRLKDNKVTLRGLISNPTIAANQLIATMPTGYRPKADILGDCETGSGPRRWNIIASTGAYSMEAALGVGYISLQGIEYFVD